VNRGSKFAIRKGKFYLIIPTAEYYCLVRWVTPDFLFFSKCWTDSEEKAVKAYEDLLGEEKVIKVLNCECNQAKTEGK
jgi:hypothetical protein